VHRLLVAASVVPSSPILVTLLKEALGSSETSVLTRATRRSISGDTIFHVHVSVSIYFLGASSHKGKRGSDRLFALQDYC
jgi:hypothetical protein